MKGTRHALKIRSSLSSPYQISYIKYGNPDASHQIFCCHGLTRNAMDFDPLSEYLCSTYKQQNGKDDLNMTSIDLCGRGQSDYVDNHTLYRIGHHLTECDDLINHLRSNQNKPITSWIGTSFGGIIGMYYAALYYPTIKHLILNDIGPFMSKQFINDLREFSNNNPLTKDMDEMKAKLKEKYGKEYGTNITDDEWKRITENATYYDDKNGGYRLCYDPNVVEGLLMDIGHQNDDGTYNDWDIFKDVWIKIPKEVKILLIRGQNSTIITRETVDKMIATNSNLSVVEIEDVGHHPLLTDKTQMDIIAQFMSLHSISS